MVGVPRSQVLARGKTSGSGGAVSFGCPAECVTLVKSVVIFNGDTAAHGISLSLATPGGTVAAYFGVATVEANAMYEWQGWHVLNPGDVTAANMAGPNMTAWISGAVLLGPPPFPPTVTVLPADFQPGTAIVVAAT